jgi:hypothetical protein
MSAPVIFNNLIKHPSHIPEMARIALTAEHASSSENTIYNDNQQIIIIRMINIKPQAAAERGESTFGCLSTRP